VIFQNPATVPPSWLNLGGRPTEICPYRGLFAFREEDAPFFFGREAFTNIRWLPLLDHREVVNPQWYSLVWFPNCAMVTGILCLSDQVIDPSTP
jgi:hypothetical protein